MNNISVNYQLNFKALVPKSQYSGTPRLSRPVICEINKLKESIKEADKEILDLETYLNNPESGGSIINYLTKRLEIFKNFRRKLMKNIAIIREEGKCNSKEHYKMFKEHSEKVEQLEEQFAQASQNPNNEFLILGKNRKVRF